MLLPNLELSEIAYKLRVKRFEIPFWLGHGGKE